MRSTKNIDGRRPLPKGYMLHLHGSDGSTLDTTVPVIAHSLSFGATIGVSYKGEMIGTSNTVYEAMDLVQRHRTRRKGEHR